MLISKCWSARWLTPTLALVVTLTAGVAAQTAPVSPVPAPCSGAQRLVDAIFRTTFCADARARQDAWATSPAAPDQFIAYLNALAPCRVGDVLPVSFVWLRTPAPDVVTLPAAIAVCRQPDPAQPPRLEADPDALAATRATAAALGWPVR